MSDYEFQVAAAVLLVSFVLHRGYYTRRAGRSDQTTVQQPEQGVLSKVAAMLALPALLGTMIYIFIPDWVSGGALPLPEWLRWTGVGIALVGYLLLQWAQHSLGANWSDNPRLLAGQELVTRGPYRWVRHPIYSAFILILGSLLLITANWFIGLTWLGMTTLDVHARMEAEEKLMLHRFGGQYLKYMQKTGRLIPRRLGQHKS
jgi:protein-S-isoprenylcysteine O-methyltransferase Ste14